MRQYAIYIRNVEFLNDYRASKSPFAELLDEYVQAEMTGRDKRECWPYYKDCPKSLFQPVHNKYTLVQNFILFIIKMPIKNMKTSAEGFV